MASSPANETVADLVGVVGIAADVGETGDVATLIEEMPDDAGLSFVVLPSARGGNTELLAKRLIATFQRRTRIADSGTALEANHIYLAPAGSDVVVHEAHLEVERASIGAERSFDHFLGSLAVDQVERSIGVVLSPERHRGSAGLDAIGRAGGCAIGPLFWGSAADTGSSSILLPADQAFRLVRERVGAHLSRVHEGRWTDVESARRPLCDEALASDRLRAVLGQLVRSRRSGLVRAWVPGCGTGQDVYTIALLLAEQELALATGTGLQIFGTDVDPAGIRFARGGFYPHRALGKVPKELRQRFFAETEGGARVVDRLRQSALFAWHDLLNDPPLSRMDLVSCRNLLADKPALLRQHAIERLHFALRGGGWLLVSPAEAGLVPVELFEVIDADLALFRARPAARLGRSVRKSGVRVARSGPSSPEDVRALTAELRALTGQRFDELEVLDRAHADLQNFVEATEVLAFICDAGLRITRSSPAIARWFGIESIPSGTLLEDLAHRLPGDWELVPLARAVQQTGRPAERTERFQSDAPRTYLVRLLPYRTQRGEIDGVVVVFTDVSAVEQARALAAKRERQQAAVAELGLAALGLAEQTPGRPRALTALYRQALDAIAGALGCTTGLVLERGGDDNLLLLRATRGVRGPVEAQSSVAVDEDDYLRSVLRATSVRVVDGPPLGSSLAQALGFLHAGAGIACQLRVADRVYGVLAVYSDSADAFLPDDLHFVQAVANVLAGEIARRRFDRRLSLERGLGMVVADAYDVPSMARRVCEVFALELRAALVELWAFDRNGSDLRLIRRQEPAGALDSRPPAADEPSPEMHAAIATGRTSVQAVPLEATGTGTEILLPLLLGSTGIGVLRIVSLELIAVDKELFDGLETCGRAIAEFIHRKRMEEALRDSERAHRMKSAELESIYESLPVGLSIHDRDMRVLRANEQVEQFWEGMNDRPVFEEPIRLVFETGEAVRDIEIQAEGQGSAEAWLCSFAPVRDADGAVVAVSSVVKDITERKRFEQALREADRQKDAFLATLGHELRNPLAAIRSATELLGVIDRDQPNVQRVFAVLDRQTRQMTKLIDGLLDVSRVIRGKLVLDLRILDLRRLLADIVDDRRRQFEDRGLEVCVDLPETPMWVEGDAVRLVQIFDNLLSNAAKFTPPGGRISLIAALHESRVSVRVEDDGIGIEPALLPYIFEPFRQARTSPDRSMGGLGLGLALVSGLVELHWGTVTATSDGPNLGSAFTIEIPRARESGPPPTLPPPLGEPLRIVLVDDNVDMMQLLSELLTTMGHEIVGLARSGEEGLEQVRAFRPDVVLCDIGLPGGFDGLRVARQIRSERELDSARLIALTGYAGTEMRNQAKEAGFEAFLVKPVTLRLLEKYVPRAMKRPS